ncbi:hypothetical protein Spaf_2058 [Streptococcus parasanguinis FW213]|uniref:Uncharacterized protein n=1 Tax=Streptococcus parasanguinis FW213 TaxID=1114965 RepID=I1ZPL7_STRPA|nr:hypothetical protein Spaf_2058 [Streptococcus parasanguinis FW213]
MIDNPKIIERLGLLSQPLILLIQFRGEGANYGQE